MLLRLLLPLFGSHDGPMTSCFQGLRGIDLDRGVPGL